MKPAGKNTVNVAVVRFPSISNFTDLEILNMEKDVVVNYLSNKRELTDEYDCLILPGTKNVMEDAAWLSGKGRSARFREYDRLADHFEKYCDVDNILKEIS